MKTIPFPPLSVSLLRGFRRLAIFTTALLAVIAPQVHAQVPGSPDSLNLHVTGSVVNTTAVQPDGRTIIAGEFTTVLGVPRSRIARLNADGTLDLGFDPKVTGGSVYSVAVQADGRIVIAGDFSGVQPNGAAVQTIRGRIARLRADGSLDNSFDPAASSTIYSTITQPDGKLLLGGSFTSFAPNGAAVSTPRNHIARLNTDGTLDAAFDPNANGDIYSMALQPDGKVVIAGGFSTLQPNGAAGSTARGHLARLNADGALDAGFDTSANSTVLSTALQPDGKILVGGAFSTLLPAGAVTPIFRVQSARLNADGTVEPGFNPTPNGYVRSFAIQADGRILFAGDFTNIQPMGAGNLILRNHIARMNADGTLDTTFAADANSIVHCVVNQADGRVFLGGEFTSVNGSARSLFARVQNDPASSTLSVLNPGQVQWQRSGSAPEIQAVTIEQSFDGTNWAALGNASRIGTSANWQLTGLALPGTGIVRARGRTSGGAFTGSSGLIEQVKEYGTPGSVGLSLNAGIVGGNVVATVPQPDGKTILIGSFSSVLGIPRNNIARLNADDSLDLSFDPNTNSSISSVLVQPDGKIVIGGSFTTLQPNNAASTTARNRIARLNSDGTLDPAFDPNANSYISSMAMQSDGAVLVCGNFTTVGGIARNKLARVNSDGTPDASFDPKPNNIVYALAVQGDGMIVLGGSFTTLQPNGAAVATARNRIARVTAKGVLDTTFDPNANNDVYAAAMQADGQILLGGAFTTVGGTARSHIARVKDTGALDSGFDPKADNDVFSFALQTDGKVLFSGFFSTLQPNGAPIATQRFFVARVNANGTLDTAFDPKADDEVDGVSVQADGSLLLCGAFTTLQPNGAATTTARSLLARLTNDPATQTLSTPDATQINWTRGGAAPGTSLVSFESSADGVAWTTLGNGTRTGNTWHLSGLNLPGFGSIRARARVIGGSLNGGGGLVEAITTYAGEIAVSGNGIDIANGDSTPSLTDHTDFGGSGIGGGGIVRTFTISSQGTTALSLPGTPQIVIGGANAADFTVTQQPAASIATLAQSIIQISFHPGAGGVRNATVSMATNDPDEASFDFSIRGTGLSTDLGGLVPSFGALSPAFSASTTSYAESVPNGVTSLKVTPTAVEATSLTTVNGIAVVSGSASTAVNLNVGPNVITTVVTATDASTTTYTLTVTRAVGNSADSNLAGLAFASVTLTPAFDPAITSYTASVVNAVSSSIITPTAADAGATIRINGGLHPSGTNVNYAIFVGTTVFNIAVTAADLTTKSYVITITRPPSSNADLFNLTTSAGAISPAFNSTTTSTTASVGNAVTSITVTPFRQVSVATLTINGVAAVNATASSPINLYLGANPIVIVVTAQDFSTKTYTLTVTRAAGASTNVDLNNLVLSTGTLAPAFDFATTSYTASVINSVTAVMLTPFKADANATIKVNNVLVASGAASSPINLNEGANVITTVVTAPNASTKTYTLNLTRAASTNNALLANLTVSAGALTPVFDSATTSYTMSVINAVSALTVTPTKADASASITVNGVAVTSGTASQSVPLNVGTTVITTIVTSANATTKTYTLTITRPPNANADLSNLLINNSSLALAPSFTSANTSYTASLSNGTSSVTITPFKFVSYSTITVNGIAVNTGVPSGAISLNVGSNVITIIVTAQDLSTKTYTLTITRAASNPSNADLSNLTPGAGPLSPGFASATLGYAMSVVNGVTALSVRPDAADSTATVTVNGAAVVSGTFSSAINLNVGANLISTIVTAGNGTTTKTYTITVTRGAISSNANLAGLAISAGTLTPPFASLTTGYTVLVSNATSSITVTPSKVDVNATVKVNNVTVNTGNASAPISLALGSAVINTVVTAQDGITTKTYTVTVMKPGSLGFASSVFTVNSGATATNADIVINRSGGTTGAVSCNLSTSNGTAMAPALFTAQTGTVVNFADGQALQHVFIPIVAKAATTTTKTFAVTLSNANGTPLTATVVILPPASATDSKKPAVTIKAPLAGANINDAPLLTITGSATDNIGISKVEVSLNNGATFTDAVLAAVGEPLTAYTFAMTPVTGANTIQVRSTDFKGNVSPVITRSFIQLRSLIVNISGPANAGGITAGYAPNSSRQVGKSLVITATPKPGFVFNGWTANSFTGTGVTTATAELPALTFTMQQGLALTASFITNPFQPNIIGTFNGLVSPSSSLPPPNGTIPGNDTTGILQNAVVQSTGSFTSLLKIDGLSLPLAGKFDNLGVARFGTGRTSAVNLVRPGKRSLMVMLQLDMSGLTGKVTGTVQQTEHGALAARSDIDADRSTYSLSAKVPTALAGPKTQVYTLIFSSKTPQPTGITAQYYPQGDGFAAMSVNVNGTVTLTGRLADHTVITASAPLVNTGGTNHWPVLAQLYALKGCLAGTATLADAAASTEDVTGTLSWFRPYQPVQWYADGWSDGIKTVLIGARYVVPTIGSVFPGLQPPTPNAAVQFTQGLLAAPINKDITISPANIVTPTNPTMLITKATGLINGVFTHTDGTKPAYQGAIIQKGASAGARGYFMTRATPLNYLGESGAVSVKAK